MKVAIILPQNFSGGAERVVSNLSFELSKYCELHVIVFNYRTEDAYELDGHVIDMDLTLRKTLFGKAMNFVKRLHRLKKIKRDMEFDCCISFLASANIANMLTKATEKRIISIRNNIFIHNESIIDRIQLKVCKVLYPKADAIVVVSKLLKEKLISEMGADAHKINTIYNPYNIENIKRLSLEPISKEEEALMGSKIMLSCGRLTYQKNFEGLIKSFGEVVKKTDYKLVIIGEGELRGKLEKLIQELGLSNKVILLGYKNNPYKYMSQSKVYVLNSFFEGFPNALVEAMICGLPVVARDCETGPKEILAPLTDIRKKTNNLETAEYGILIPDAKSIGPNQRDYLYEAIETLENNPALRDQYIRKSLDYCSRWDTSIIGKEYFDLIAKAIRL
ncbi:glycosyltransferase [Petrocella sp. FN5]|uniref:glycosyltransferase n=1 Tax=Petrocella sp. FN5 TaxID=3032002 RepID=UPI0023DC824D|nr:glycosyltransferase [Petrocella sp. FN5]MDF1617762.1 glycosyltransferase [Petrocella sp. FN5]